MATTRLYIRGTPEQRFWPRVEKTAGCWLWTGGAKNNKGYGQITVGKGKAVFAHRLSYEIANGPIPAGMSVCHHCDTPACVNPAHLFLGTHSDNMRDAYRKGRLAPPIGMARRSMFSASHQPPGVVRWADRTHCAHGHALTPENVKVVKRTGLHECRRCRRRWDKQARDKRKQRQA